MGLHDAQDSLGGEMAWGLGLSVFTPVFLGKSHWPVRTHGFLNVGKIVGYDRGESVQVHFLCSLPFVFVSTNEHDEFRGEC